MSDNSHDIEANKLDHRRPSSVDNNALAQTITLSSEQFERLYLSPKTAAAGDLRKTFANPTPLGVAGVAIGLFPLSIELSKCLPSYTLPTRNGLASKSHQTL